MLHSVICDEADGADIDSISILSKLGPDPEQRSFGSSHLELELELQRN